MEINTLAQLVSSVGFPIVVCGWLLYERYKFTNKLIDALNLLSTNVMKQTDILDRLEVVLNVIRTHP